MAAVQGGSRGARQAGQPAPKSQRSQAQAASRPASTPGGTAAHPPLNTKTAKFHRLIRLLQASETGLTIRNLASTLGVDERTVKRYLADLRRLKFDMIQTSEAGGRGNLYRLQATGGPPQHLLASLKKVRSELLAGGNPKYTSLISQVIRHLEEKEAADTAPAALPGPDVYYIDHGPFAEADPHPGMLKILEGAVASHTAVRISYSGYAKEAEELLFFPYVLCLRVGTLYLIGRQGANSGPFKSLSVKRIRRCIASRDSFVPEPFSPSEYYKYTFGQWHRQLGEEPVTVVLALKSPWLEKYLAESHFNPPGKSYRKGKEAFFELKVVIKPDFVNWVLSLVPDLVPLRPESLRKEVADRLLRGQAALARD